MPRYWKAIYITAETPDELILFEDKLERFISKQDGDHPEWVLDQDNEWEKDEQFKEFLEELDET